MDLPDEFRYMSFIIVEDPDGRVRLQKQLAWGEQNLGIGAGPEDTTIGGVPGRIQAGTWQVGLGIFTEYLNQRLGEREGQITMTVSDEKGAVSDPMDTCWVEITAVMPRAKNMPAMVTMKAGCQGTPRNSPE